MLIVEEVSPDSIAAQAGIRPGDRLLAYAGQPLGSPAHLQALEENTFSDQPLNLELEREGKTWEKNVTVGKLGVSVRPEMSEEILAFYEKARQEQQAGRVNEAAEQLEQAARQTAVDGDNTMARFLFVVAGDLYEQEKAWERALQIYAEGKKAFDVQEDLASLIQLQIRSGVCSEKGHDYESAVACYEQAGALAQRATYPMWQARCLNHLGIVAWYQGQLSLAEPYFTRALAIREKLAPGSLDMAASLTGLGIVAWNRGNLSSAQDYLLRALAIKEKASPESVEVASTLNNLGTVSWNRGDLSSAQDYFNRGLAIFEKLAPESMEMAACLNNLGNVVAERGDLALAHEYYTRALAVFQILAPDSLQVASSLNNIGTVAYDRGDLALAEDYHGRSLEIREKLAPGSLDMGHSLIRLGDVAYQRGDFPSAQNYFLRSLAIHEELAPDSIDMTYSLDGLGDVANGQGNLTLAQEYYRRSLAIREKLAPGSLNHADNLEQIGQVYLRQHQPQQALGYLQQALEVVEKQRAAIQATDARALLLAKYTSTFLALVRAYRALDQQHAAFSVLERLRARSLHELLAERHFILTDVSQELLQQQQELDQQQAQAYTALAQLSLSDQKQIEQLHARLHLLDRQQQYLAARLRATDPGYAALHYPKPLNAKATQKLLETGTLLLSFLVGDEISYLFTVTKKELSCYELPAGQKALEEKVQAFREALDVFSLESTLAEAIEQGQQLYALLLSPAQTAIDKARRLLVCADGPLHLLPFAALVVKTDKNPVFIGQLKPMHTTFSMTVYAQIRQLSSNRAGHAVKMASATREKASQALETLSHAAADLWQQGRKMLALGDPVYAPAGRQLALAGTRSTSKKPSENPELAGLRSRGLSLDPLPHTREEVEAIAALFSEQAVVRMGEEATKTIAIQESQQADIIHFACHGWLDAKMPLSSGLILSQPEAMGKKTTEQDNGLLQAWEIFKLRLKADLVVLSACQTGLGAEIRGEGLIGLSRAFTYAGAKSVLVSLWEIHDASTAEFMKAFYQALKQGKSKDKALQAAIKKLSKTGKWQHPFFWSAFSLVGDWR